MPSIGGNVPDSLGNLKTVLPPAIGMIMVNGLDPSGLFFSVGLP